MDINNEHHVSPYTVKDIYFFQNAHQQAIFNKIVHHLRCSVCKNQTLSDSEASLAFDLRKEIYEKVQSESPEREIIEFITARYGDFVLYEPPLKLSTALLWFGPFILLLFGMIAFAKYIKWN